MEDWKWRSIFINLSEDQKHKADNIPEYKILHRKIPTNRYLQASSQKRTNVYFVENT